LTSKQSQSMQIANTYKVIDCIDQLYERFDNGLAVPWYFRFRRISRGTIARIFAKSLIREPFVIPIEAWRTLNSSNVSQRCDELGLSVRENLFPIAHRAKVGEKENDLHATDKQQNWRS